MSKPEKKYKTKIDVVDEGNLRGSCSCGWKGQAFLQSLGLSKAMSDAQSEIQAHQHLPQVKKTRKKRGTIEGVV